MTAFPRVEALVVDVAADRVRASLSRARVAETARAVLHGEGVRDALVSITFVSRRRIAALNRTHLGHSGATDVISFGFRRATRTDPVVGDIYICPDVARETAASFGVSTREELTRLVVHGVLHILGHEHPEEGAREESPMWVKQEGIVRRLMTERASPLGVGRKTGRKVATKAAKKAAKRTTTTRTRASAARNAARGRSR